LHQPEDQEHGQHRNDHVP